MLSDSDSSSSESHGDIQLTINEHFAKAYKSKKEREELQNLKDKYGSDAVLSEDDEDDSEDETEDEDGEELTPAMDVAVLRTIAKIKNRDPVIYDSKKNVFEEEENTTSELQLKRKQKGKSKALTIKQHALNAVLDDANSRSPSPTPAHLTYVQEQEALRKETISAFKTAVTSDDEGGHASDNNDFLVPREKTKDEVEQEEEEYREFLEREIGPNVNIKELITVDDQVERIHEEGEGETRIQSNKPKKKKKSEKSKQRSEESEQDFLINYIFNRGWIDKSAQRVPTYAEITDGKKDKADKKSRKHKNETSDNQDVQNGELEGEQAGSNRLDEVDEEDDFDNFAETFESSYNFRFEEPGATTIASHPRQLPNTVRRVDTSRKDAREKKKERKEEIKAVKREEVNRLKALKVREIRSKIEKIEKEAGMVFKLDEGALERLENELEDDWDAEKYDQKMKELYGDDGFYEVEDHDKPAWDDDIDITDIIGANNDGIGAEAASSKKKKRKQKNVDDNNIMTDGIDESQMDADAIPEGGMDWEQEWDGTEESRKKLWDKYMDEVYELEFNDMIGDMPTRFKYATVPSDSFALTPAEMLLATDKELNEYMSVKKFAPYRHKNKGAWDKDRNAKLQELRKAIAARTWDGVPLGQLNKSQGGHRSKADRNDGSTWDEQKKKKRIGKKERQKQKLLKEGAEANENGGGDPIAAAMAIDDGASERPKKKRKREES